MSITNILIMIIVVQGILLIISVGIIIKLIKTLKKVEQQLRFYDIASS